MDDDSWLIVDADGNLGECTSEQALTAIFGPHPGLDEPGLEVMLDASVEAGGNSGVGLGTKRPAQRTLHDVIGKPKAKAKAKTHANAISHSTRSASSSDHSHSTRSASNPSGPDGPNQRDLGSALFPDENRATVDEDEDPIFSGVPLLDK